MARPTEPTLATPEWATDPTVQVAGTAPTDANDVITPSSADQGTGWTPGAGGPTRQLMNWLQRSAGEWLTWARNVLRSTPYTASSMADGLSASATDGTKPAAVVLDLSAVRSEAWGEVWAVNQGGATSDVDAVDTDGEYVILGNGTSLVARERDTPSTELWTKTMPASIVDVSCAGDHVFVANALNLRRYTRDGTSFSEIAISGTGSLSRIIAAGDRLAVLRRDLGSATSKLELYNASTLAIDATFGTKSRAQVSTGLAINESLVVFGGPVDTYHASAYDRDTGTNLWNVTLDTSGGATPTVAAIAASADFVALLHDEDGNGNEVTLVSPTGRTVWQVALFESTPSEQDIAIDDRYVYVLTATQVHVLDIHTGVEVAEFAVPGAAGNRITTDGDLLFVGYDYDATDTTNVMAFRVLRDSQLWQRHAATERYRSMPTLLTPQR